MRNAVIGLFPGQVLKDKDSAEVETGSEAATGHRYTALPLPEGTQLGAELQEAPQLHPAWKRSVSVRTVWLRVGRSDLSLLPEENTEQVTDRKKSNLFISLPAAGIQTGKTSPLTALPRCGDVHTKKRCLSFSFE